MPKRALFLAGGWDGHQPQVVSALVAGLLERSGFEAVVSGTLDALLDADELGTYDLIVPVWSMGVIGRQQLDNLLNAVKNGAGLGGWHGGMADSFRDSTDYQFMVGGQFVAHPGGIIDFTVEIADHSHPITAGLGGFALRSEQYYMHTDPSNTVLATTTFGAEHAPWIGGTVMPAVWTRQYGTGRVFYASFGHAPEDFDVPEAREIVLRGLKWAAR